MAKTDKEDASEVSNQKTTSLRRPILILFLVASIFALPSVVVLATLMIPTFIAILMDRHIPKTLGMTVGCMNFAGASVGWLELVRRGHDIRDALNIAMEPNSVFFAYGFAFFGWVLYLNIAPFVARMTVRKAQMRVKRIRKRQEKLKKDWGTPVSKQEVQAVETQEEPSSEAEEKNKK